MIIIYYKKEDGNYRIYDGKKVKTIEKLPRQAFEMLGKNLIANKKSLKAYYKRFMKESYELQKEGIDITRYRSYYYARMYMFNQFLPRDQQIRKGRKLFHSTDRIDQDESRFIENCNNMGRIFYQPGKYSNVTAIDRHSYFSSILGNTIGNFQIPIRKPSFHYINDVPTKAKYGIYHCMITYNGTRKTDLLKLFSFSKGHHYTHTDINLANHLKNEFPELTLRMEDDGEPNAMIYDDDDLIRSTEFFGPWYRYLSRIKIKYPSNTIVKQLLNMWGFVCRSGKHIGKRIMTIDQINAMSDKKNYTFEPYYDESTPMDFDKFTAIKHGSTYDYGIARLKPFLMATARSRLNNVVRPHLDSIVRIYVDGIIINKPPSMDIHKGRNQYSVDDKYHDKSLIIQDNSSVTIL